ncbi:MAG: alpha/beta fold hydrolase [Rhodobacteraceae bacterium]|nr:alpha/beta fold hydrolase [Phaeodactylibacter sp.]MCB1353766.1 alpha/beta fold hydrolase [Paracoccaceae bacterium]
MPFAEYKDARVSWKIDGSGPPLVLVHGTGGDAESNWAAVVPQLGRHWTVIRPEFSGSGATTDGGGPLSAEDVAGQVLAAAEAAGAGRFHLMGFSLGAAIAARIAGAHPERVRALVLLAGFQSGGDTRMALQFGLWRDLIARDRAAMARLILLTGFSPEALAGWSAAARDAALADILETTDWEGMARQVALDEIIDVSASVRAIRVPTLVIGCAEDQMVPVAHARGLARDIPGAVYAELPTGHLAPLEQPAALAEMVAAFLARQA